ncbi:MAG: ribonuclease J [Clostridia bacterium]|nr:ribonuclease J [Clostridia bacterium]
MSEPKQKRPNGSSAKKKYYNNRANQKSAKSDNESKSGQRKTGGKNYKQNGKSFAKKNYNYEQKSKKNPSKPIKIIPLGGLDEIGKNITLYEYDGDMMLVDCGMSFPDEETPGIDIVIPDFSYILECKEKIKGLVITHGHEDHIGAIPYLLKEFNVPIFATRLTVALISEKLKEHRLLGDAKLNVVNAGETVNIGKFAVEFIHVNHSIPDAVGFAITTPAGTVIQTGDFKIDTTPIDDKMIDLARFAELGKKGVLALLSDSTNAERPGYTPSERLVGSSLETFFSRADGKRIVVATFSSNIHRIQQIINQAVKCGRKVAVSGRSMLNVVKVASELGYLNVPEGVLIEIETIKNYPPEKIVIVTTGSQGEPLSALHRIAFSEHRQVEIIPGDMFIISATPIPGNEKTVSNVVNELIKRGANVVYERMYDVHVSGHACQEELKTMLSIVKPKYFIPVHGEQKHLYKHSLLGLSMGMDRDNIILAGNGNVIELTKNGVKTSDYVQAGRVLVDGLGIGDVGSIVLRDRKHLAEGGIIVVTVVVDATTREVLSRPEIVSRGFVFVKESEELMLQIEGEVYNILEACYRGNIRDWNVYKTRIKDGVGKFLYNKTHRSPMVLPIVIEI